MNRKEQRIKYWHNHYTAYLESGLTQRDYCKQNEIGYYSFNTWKRKFEKSKNDTSLQKIPFKISEKNLSSYSQLEIIFPGDIRLLVPDNFSPETLKKIIITLGELK